MKLYNIHDDRPSRSMSYASLLEKIEILRSSLRWGHGAENPQITKALHQCNIIRDEVMKLSHQASFIDAYAGEPNKKSRKPNKAQRRQALIDRKFVFEGVFGESADLLEALETAEKAAPTNLPVLIYGESGTGKELMAKVIHSNGARADKPYVSVNCGAIPDNLIESELFGHKKGAFSGASSDRKGKFESADGGTIFLDEIGELPLEGQVKLLRVLQSNELQRVGSDEVVFVDARIVAATNRDLAEMCAEGKFREDLYYRLSVIDVTLPPLRDRRDEIPLLIDYFTTEAAESLQRPPIKMTPRLRTFMIHYAYPGNIRELRNIVYRVSCLADGFADIEHLPVGVRGNYSQDCSAQKKKKEGYQAMLDRPLAEIKKEAASAAEKLYLEQGLIEEKGKVVNLARRIGMNRSHVWTLIKKNGIKVEDFKKKKRE